MRYRYGALNSLHVILLVPALACGPQAPMTDDSSSTGTTATGSTTTAGAPTTGDAATTVVASTSSASTTAPATTTTGAADSTTAAGDTSSSTGGTTTTSEPSSSSFDDGFSVCHSPGICEESEDCTPEARVNADIGGMTPLGPFTGTFAYASVVLVAGELGTLRVVPAYATDVCEVKPELRFDLGPVQDGDFVIEAPVTLEDGQGNVVQTTATVHVKNCCSMLWFCTCKNPSPYEVEVSVVTEGWSLAGSALPNCCRSHSTDEAA